MNDFVEGNGPEEQAEGNVTAEQAEANAPANQEEEIENQPDEPPAEETMN